MNVKQLHILALAATLVMGLLGTALAQGAGGGTGGGGTAGAGGTGQAGGAAAGTPAAPAAVPVTPGSTAPTGPKINDPSAGGTPCNSAQTSGCLPGTDTPR
jgi:hypothetical protein